MTASWPPIASRNAAPSCTSSLSSTRRLPTCGFRKAGMRSGFKSAIVTRSTPGCCNKSYAEPDPCRRSEEHTSELQSHHDLVCRLLLEKKKTNNIHPAIDRKRHKPITKH